MTTLKNSRHFVSHIPKIEGSTPFREVYAQLYDGGHGGFILAKGGQAVSYVKAHELAAHVVAEAKGDGEKMRRLSNTPIELLVVNETQLPVHRTPIDVSADEMQLQNQPDTVFDITESGKSTGWYLENKTVRSTLTERTVWVCKNKHKNPDPDHGGTCYSCPFPVFPRKE